MKAKSGKKSMQKDAQALIQALSLKVWQDRVFKVIGTIPLPNKTKHFVTVIEMEDHSFETITHRMEPKNHPTCGLKYRMGTRKKFILITSP